MNVQKKAFQGLCLAAFLVLMTLPGHANVETATVKSVIEEIRQTYEKINDLQAEFVQTVEIQGFNTTYVSTGKLFIKKGKMLWDYVEPGKQMIYVNGGGFQFYVPDHKQVIRSKVGGQSDTHLPLQLLSGLGQLDQDFEVSFEIEPPKPGEAVHLNLVPKKNMGLTNIVITVIPSSQIEGLVIDQVVLYEQNGNVSTSIFEKVKINKGLDDDLFDFKVPEGVEIIDGP
ncbi:MAG: outer membrane lipoprotein carrier protein LolA [Nitrospiria bacterium]